MLQKLHELKKSEEGQTLVLAALFGLVLMLCVLGTVNLGRTVYDKVQLQTAADNAAYSTAAVEARVLNFTAYTNRAMVVHYASIMAATSYLTWVHFNWGILKPVLTALSFVPAIGAAFKAIEKVLSTLVKVLDVILVVYVPLLSIANATLWALQEGAWNSVYAQLVAGVRAEAHSGDGAGHRYVEIAPTLIPLANATVFSQVRGDWAVPLSTANAMKVMANKSDDNTQLARMQMIEIANSARDPWTAYGDRLTNPTWLPSARHWRLGIPLPFLSCAKFEGVGRTELGTFRPSSGWIGNLTGAVPEVWSGQRWQLDLHCNFLFIHINGRKPLAQFMAADDFVQSRYPSRYKGPSGFGGLLGTILKPILKPIEAAVAKAAKPSPDYRPFFLAPYVYFAPHAGWKQGLSPSQGGHFNQPDVLVGLAKEGRDFNKEPGAAVFGRKFSISNGAAGKGSVDFGYTNADWPKMPWINLMHKGLNAFSAAQVYYHRPGEWREMPNLFNPLWGARLMPVLDSNAVNLVPGLRQAKPIFSQFLQH